MFKVDFWKRHLNKKKRKTNVGQSDVNLSPLVLPCSKISIISLVQGGVYCLPCGGWALFVHTHTLFWYIFTTCVCVWGGEVLVHVYCRVFSYWILGVWDIWWLLDEWFSLFFRRHLVYVILKKSSACLYSNGWAPPPS